MKKDRSHFPSQSREAKNAYMRHERQNPQEKRCLCGEQAVMWCNGFVCERCRRLEKAMHQPESVGRGRSYADIEFRAHAVPLED